MQTTTKPIQWKRRAAGEYVATTPRGTARVESFPDPSDAPDFWIVSLGDEDLGFADTLPDARALVGNRLGVEPMPAPAQDTREPETRSERRSRAVQMTRDLLDAHDLGDVYVELSSRAKRKAGSCHYRGGRACFIRLAEWAVDGAPWAEVVDLIRHEVAHAICGPGKGHGAEWKRAAVSVGAKPERCYNAEMATAKPPAKYVGGCKCAADKWKRLRLSESTRKHGRCPACRELISWRRNG